ncbi:AI-2E family transporter [Vulgatibacter sp.]|uniref:AI-2E family transporter n=1 Tax=Vulgatibacter sp. TaxID=1971226 RepID=UPI0035660989
MPERKSWPSFRYIAGAAATVLLVWALAQLLGRASTPIFLFVVGVLLAFLLHYPIDFFSRLLPRPLATLLVLLLLLGAFGLVGWWFLPRLYHQAAVLVGRIPELVDRATNWWDELQRRAPFTALPGGAGEVPATIEQQLVEKTAGLVSNALPLAFGLFTGIIAAVFVLGVAFFLAFRPSLYVEGILRLVPRRHEDDVRAFVHRLFFVIRGWIVGALLSMTTVGSLTALGTWALGLDSWLFLGTIAFALEIVPYAGPILSAVPAVALALTQSPELAIYTTLLYIVIQQIEGNAVTPIIMKRAIELPPAILLLWQIAMVTAFGIVALFVAAPLLAVVMVAVDHFYVRGTLQKGDPPPRN